MGFWMTALAMALGGSLSNSLPKVIHWMWMRSPGMVRWQNRCYGSTRWMVFAPKWMKRLFRKEK